MNERSLAHIEVIESLSPIEGADKIEVAQVLGWQCVVKKGEFKVGDKIIYCEIDSVMPDKPEFEFLRDRKFRIRTIKLRGQVSQGLVLPIESMLGTPNLYKVGDDVTKDLGITKYLSPSEQSELQQQEEKIKLEKNKLKKFLMRYSWFRRLFLSRSQAKGWPYWVAKTDEPRCQNLHWDEFYETYKNKEVYVTEKIDYQSVTFTGKMMPNTTPIIGRFLPKKYKFIVCSRNFTTNDKDSLYWKIAKKYNIEEILKANPNLTIQGEQGDTKVQKNKYGIKEPTMWVFNIIDHERDYHYNYLEMEDFCQTYNLNIVPLLMWQSHTATLPLWKLGSTVQELLEFAKGKSVLADIPREGIVIRCIENGKKVFSFKAINNDFLLKYD
jgi:hypothetical protein